jgi:hypothetical protein
MGFTSEIKDVSKSKYATAALYTFLGGLILSDALPTPADAVFFSYQKKIRDDFFQKKITPAQYWRREAIGYYGFNVAWWLLVSAIVIASKGSAEKKLKIAGVIIGGGAVLAIIHQNIRKDEKEQELEEQQKIELLKQHPEIIKILNRPEFKNISTQFKNVTGEKLKKQNV